MRAHLEKESVRPHEAAQSLARGVVPALHVAGLARALAGAAVRAPGKVSG